MADVNDVAHVLGCKSTTRHTNALETNYQAILRFSVECAIVNTTESQESPKIKAFTRFSARLENIVPQRRCCNPRLLRNTGPTSTFRIVAFIPESTHFDMCQREEALRWAIAALLKILAVWDMGPLRLEIQPHPTQDHRHPPPSTASAQLPPVECTTSTAEN